MTSMKKVAAAVMVASVGFAAPATAVDLVNRDKVEREAVVNQSDGQSAVVTVKPGQRVANVCVSCVILVGETSVEAVGRVVAVIEDGKVTVAK
jgi:uncharacterized protein (UPF0548 family)